MSDTLLTVVGDTTITTFSANLVFNPVISTAPIDTSLVPITSAPAPSNKSQLDQVIVSDSLRERYSKLFQDGYLVNLHISVWGMCANLDEKDLKLEKKVSKLIKLGKKMLINPERLNEFKNMESKARRYLYSSAYDFPISDAHFVPKKRLGDVITKLEEYKVEFNALVDKFVENYEAHKQEILDNEEYVDIVDVLRPLYPTADVVRDKFGFDMAIFEIAMPQAFEETDIQELINRDEAKEEVKQVLKNQLKAQHENSMRLLEQFTEDAAITLRAKLVKTCKGVIEKIENKELISKANINSIREEINNFRSLNFMDDSVVEAEVAKLQVLIDGNHNFKTDQETIATLNDAVSSVLKRAEDISDVADLRGTYFRKIKV